VVAARELGPGPFGVLALGWTVFRFASLIGTVGLDKAVVRFGAGKGRGRVIVAGLVGVTVSGCLTATGVVLLAPWLARAVFGEPELASILRTFSIAIVAYGIMRVCTQATLLEKDVKWSLAIEEGAQPATELATVTLAAVTGAGVLITAMGLSVSYVLASFVAMVVVITGFLPSRSDIRVDLAELQRLALYGLPASASAILVMSMFWMDKLLLGALGDTSDVGLYQSASQLPMALALVAGSFGTIVRPLLADLYERADAVGLRLVYRAATKWLLLLIGPIIVPMLIMPRTVLEAVFGSSFTTGYVALAILAGCHLVNVGVGLSGIALNMTDNHRAYVKLTASGTGVAVVGNVLLIPVYGVTGAAIGTGGGLLVLAVGSFLLLKRRLGFEIRDIGFVGPCAAIASAVALASLGTRGLDLHGAAERLTFALVASGATVTGVSMWVGFDDEERDVLVTLVRGMGGNGV